MKKILFQDTSFRDGFQSIFGARAFTKDFTPAVEAACAAGIQHFEAGGGARFQALYQNVGEDAFDMMDEFRRIVGPNVRLQTLARGINVVALEAQPKDMIKLHADMFKKHGMTRIRNFDALNDVNNLIFSGQCIHDAGLEHEVVITMMELPLGCTGAHDPEFYIKTLKDILNAGIPYSSICFKDASGTCNPRKVYETIKLARKLLGDSVEIRMHTHDTCGTGVAQYVAAIEGGCSGVDLARKPLSGGTGQPDLFSLYHALKGTDYKLALGDGIVDDQISKIMEANNVSVECLKDYEFPPEALQISTDVIFSPMPGGALTANTLMMRETKTFHLYDQVIANMSECVSRGGFASSVTPVSQFYFQQAFVNTVNKSKGLDTWAKMTEGYGKMILGYYGKTPTEPDPELVKIAAEQLKMEPFAKVHPGVLCAADIIEPGIPKAKKLLEENNLPITDENIFIVGALNTKGGNKGIDFLKGNRKIGVPKKDPNAAVAPKAAPAAPAVNTAGMTVKGTNTYRIGLNGQSWDVQVSSLK